MRVTRTDVLSMHVSITLLATSLTSTLSFAPSPANGWGVHRRTLPIRHPTPLDSASDSSTDATTDDRPTAVRAPLKYAGPYPCLPLRFPNLATKSQAERNATGISLDFVLDTAANTNTINAGVASELGLEVVGAALPGVGAGGAISGGETYMLGDCELDGLPAEEEAFTFMSGLTGSALPVAAPSAAGLLGLYFFNAFPGGVEFAWGSSPPPQGPDSSAGGIVPSVTFFSDREGMDGALEDLQRVPVSQLPVSGLPSVVMSINGVEIPALFDTGSPITVLNAEAARLAGVETTAGGGEADGAKKNPFAKLTQGFKTAQAAARGDVLLIAGASGERVELVKSKESKEVSVGDVKMGESNVYVGDLPGLAALGGLGGSSAPPAAVLGLDILRLRPRMVYRPDEVYL